jgi:hypothetical protein
MTTAALSCNVAVTRGYRYFRGMPSLEVHV